MGGFRIGSTLAYLLGEVNVSRTDKLFTDTDSSETCLAEWRILIGQDT